MHEVVRLEARAMPQQLGRYRLIETLGRGGMGTIHLAVASGLAGFRKLVVLKVLREELTLDGKFVELFMREATVAACLNHPNVVHTVEASQEDGYYFLVLEFLDGQPLRELLRVAKQEPAVPLALRLQVLCDALLGLHYVHELTDYDGRALHLVHRDVSPPNIFVTYDGQVKLLDFGIAKTRDVEQTRPGEFKGKLSYAAPEQLRGMPADRRVDVFAAGVVLWESIALRHLVQGKSARQSVEARLSGTEPRIAQIVEGVDPALAAICDRAMHHDPEERYPSADALRLALQSYLNARDLSVETASLGLFMRSKFASSRAAVHRRIDTHMRESASIDSIVTTVGALPSVRSAPAPIELRRAFDERRGYTPISSVEPRRPRGSGLRWLALTVLAAFAIGAWLFRERWNHQPVATQPAGRPTDSAQSAPADPAAQPRAWPAEPAVAPGAPDAVPSEPRVVPAEPEAAAPGAPDTAPATPPAESAAVAPDGSDPAPPEPRSEPAVGPESGEAPGGAPAAQAQGPGIGPGAAPASLGDEPSKSATAPVPGPPKRALQLGRAGAVGRPAPKRAAPPARMPARPQGHNATASPRAAPSAATREFDLRNLRKRERRPLDLDNPFR